jgi:Terminase RNaseH-like domain
VAEVNNGGEMVENTIRMVDSNMPFTAVRASRGKVTRAEPVSALYEQGRMHHIGTFPQLEDQMTNFTSDFDRQAAGYSPDRVDALVWAATESLVENMNGWGIFELYRRKAAAIEAEKRGEEPPPIIREPEDGYKKPSLQEVYDNAKNQSDICFKIARDRSPLKPSCALASA